MGDQRRGRRLAVGAGDGDERRVDLAAGALAREDLDAVAEIPVDAIKRQEPVMYVDWVRIWSEE